MSHSESGEALEPKECIQGDIVEVRREKSTYWERQEDLVWEIVICFELQKNVNEMHGNSGSLVH